jgi:hypothetical protein
VPSSALRQLSFPFADPPSPVSIEPLGRATPPWSRTRLALGSRAVVVACTRTDHGATVRLEALHDGRGARSIALDLRLRPIHVATIRSDSPWPLHWAMQRTVGADPREFFTYAERWLVRNLAGDSPRRGRHLPIQLAVRPVLRGAAAAIAATLDPRLRRTASLFAPSRRARVASALARDPRGWLLQAARAHPGLVLLGLALEGVEETEDAGLALLHGLSSGRRLGPALDAAVEAWARALPAWAAQSELWTCALRGAFAAAAERRGDARARLLAAQKVLARRAGPWCEPEALLVPPPLRFAPEDVPSDPVRNMRWFWLMKVPGVTVETRPPPADPAFAEAFAAFVSRHAAVIGRWPRDIDRAAWLSEVAAVLRASGRTPSRATDPARLVAQVSVPELRARLAEERRALFRRPPLEATAPPAAAPARAVRCSATISPRAFEPWRSENARVVQITTLAELREEGVRVRNCVASYRPLVERGELVVLSASVAGRPITIAVRPNGRGWRLDEWKGFANRRLTPPEVEALRPWMQANGVAEWVAR